jgi:hypothetical protein
MDSSNQLLFSNDDKSLFSNDDKSLFSNDDKSFLLWIGGCYTSFESNGTFSQCVQIPPFAHITDKLLAFKNTNTILIFTREETQRIGSAIIDYYVKIINPHVLENYMTHIGAKSPNELNNFCILAMDDAGRICNSRIKCDLYVPGPIHIPSSWYSNMFVHGDVATVEYLTKQVCIPRADLNNILCNDNLPAVIHIWNKYKMTRNEIILGIEKMIHANSCVDIMKWLIRELHLTHAICMDDRNNIFILVNFNDIVSHIKITSCNALTTWLEYNQTWHNVD